MPVLIGLAGWTYANPPDLFVSADSRMAGLRTPAGELVMPFGGRGFVAETWRRRSGLDATMKGPKPSDVVGLRCDSIGCLYRKEGRTIALVKESHY